MKKRFKIDDIVVLKSDKTIKYTVCEIHEDGEEIILMFASRQTKKTKYRTVSPTDIELDYES